MHPPKQPVPRSSAPWEIMEAQKRWAAEHEQVHSFHHTVPESGVTLTALSELLTTENLDKLKVECSFRAMPETSAKPFFTESEYLSKRCLKHSQALGSKRETNAKHAAS